MAAFNPRERILIIITLICVGILVTDWLIITPLYQVWKERSERIDQLTIKIEEGKGLVKRKDSINKRWTQMIEQSLPPEETEAEKILFEKVDQWTRKSRIERSSLKRDWEVDKDTAPKMELRITAKGNLNTITRFLYELETDDISTRVDKLALSSQNDRGSDLKMDIVLTSRGLNDE